MELSPGRHRVRLGVVRGDPGLVDLGMLVFEDASDPPRGQLCSDTPATRLKN